MNLCREAQSCSGRLRDCVCIFPVVIGVHDRFGSDASNASEIGESEHVFVFGHLDTLRALECKHRLRG